MRRQCITDSELQLAVDVFAADARTFYANAKKELDMPYEECFFVAAVCGAYELLLSGKKLTLLRLLRNAVARVKANNCKISRLRAFRETKKVFEAKKKVDWKNRTKFNWKRYCVDYVEKIRGISRGDARRMLDYYLMRYQKQLSTYSVESFAFLVAVICLV